MVKIKIRPSSKHAEVLCKLEQDIVAGRFDHDGRLPSEAELCRRFGVSRPTIARAMRELVASQRIERRAGAGTSLVRQSSGHTFGLLVPGLGQTEIFDPLCGEIAKAARASNADVVMSGTDASSQAIETRCSEFIERRVAGVFFASLEPMDDRHDLNRRIAERLSKAGIAVVLIDRDLAGIASLRSHDLVAMDHIHAGFTLAQHLIERGCRSIGYVVRPGYSSTSELRIAGCREAAARAGLTLKINVGDPQDAMFARGLTDSDGCDGLVCANDLTAAHLMRTLGDLAIRVPEDVRLVGIDDVRYASLLPVPLTTMRQPCAALGHVAVATMFQRLADPTLPPRQILLNAKLIVRKSSA